VAFCSEDNKLNFSEVSARTSEGMEIAMNCLLELLTTEKFTVQITVLVLPEEIVVNITKLEI
jgi:hypothetical protein